MVPLFLRYEVRPSHEYVALAIGNLTVQVLGALNDGLHVHVVGEPGMMLESNGSSGLSGPSTQMDFWGCLAQATQDGSAPLSDFVQFTCATVISYKSTQGRPNHLKAGRNRRSCSLVCVGHATFYAHTNKPVPIDDHLQLCTEAKFGQPAI